MFKHPALFTLFLLWAFGTTAMAGSTANDFPELKQYAKSLGNQPQSEMQRFHAEDHFENYSEHPPEEGHYQGVEVEDSNLEANGVQALTNDAVGQEVIDNILKRPRFDINKNSEAIRGAKLIEDESYNITHGISSERVNCMDKTPVCETTWKEESCYTTPVLPSQTCRTRRIAGVGRDEINQTINIDFKLGASWFSIVSINLVTGVVTHNVNEASIPGKVLPLIPFAHTCESINASVEAIHVSYNDAILTIFTLPSCSNNATLELMFQSFWQTDISIALHVLATSQPFLQEEHWTTECRSLDEYVTSGICRIEDAAHCTGMAETRIINGLPVTRDCWEMETSYACTSGEANTCGSQKQKGCHQTSSRCVSLRGNVCSQYEETWQCPEKNCPLTPVCTKDVFCADGDCTEKLATSNDNFSESVSALAAAGAVGQEFERNQVSMFAGHAQTCKIWDFNVIDCCADKGWGKKINLAHCRDEDKALGRAKLNYQAHYLGRYCATKVLGECTEWKHTYCVFDSKMARIIQEEGRLKQVNASAMGTAKHPTCAGLSITELQQLDMEKIDFVTPVYPFPGGKADAMAGIAGDINPRLPNVEASTDAIKQRMQDKVKPT